MCARSRYVSGALEAPRTEIRNGVRVHRLRATHFGRTSHLGRITDYATFLLSALFWIVANRRYDLLVTLTTPPLLPVLGLLVRRLLGLPYGIWSMDLHPEAEVAVGMLPPEGVVTRILTSLADRSYRGAAFVVDLGLYMKRRIVAKGVLESRVHTIPVWSRSEEAGEPAGKENPLREELGLEGKYVVMYSGNAGLVHRFEEILDAVLALRGHPLIHFLFVGGGPRRGEIERFAIEHQLENLTYLDYFPRDQLKHSLSLGDAHFLSLRAEASGISVPAKLYGIFAAARPVLMVGPHESDSAETITAAGAGYVFDPDSLGEETGKELAARIEELADSPGEGAALGARGREAFLAHYEADGACRQWAALLEERLPPSTPTPPESR